MSADSDATWPVMTIEQANAMLASQGSPLALEDGEVGGVPMKVYSAAPPTIPSIVELAKAMFGARDYLVYEDERITYDAFHRAVSHFAGALKEFCDVIKGDRVAIVLSLIHI